MPSHLDYERHLAFKARAVGTWAFEVRASLDDPEHRVALDLLVGTDARVLAACLELDHAPFAECSAASKLARRLVGIDLRDAPTRVLASRLAGSDGCFHVLELAEPALRFATNVLASIGAGWDAMHPVGPGARDAMQAAGLTQCLAFRGDEEARGGRGTTLD